MVGIRKTQVENTMMNYLHTALNPDAFHGHGKSAPFFEGWYFKLIDAQARNRIAVIPGIFVGQHNTHAFIQLLDGMSGHSTYHPYPAEQFSASAKTFDVSIAANRFARDCLLLNIDDGERPVSGELRFSGVTPFPVTLLEPGIMGPFGWLTFMECYHGIVSLDHTIEGWLVIGGKRIDFSGGRGYIEKDWGQAFPSAYIWQQSNHFETDRTCLSASIAMIPNFGFTFRGFIIAFWHRHKLYRFATYTGAKVVKLELTDEHVLWVVRGGRYELSMYSTRAEGGLLHAPVRTEMHRRVNETLKATIEVELVEREGKNRALLFRETGRCAGLEVHGDLETLLNS
jgi:hypothetical protein